MAKLYSENTSNFEQLKPRKETIRFLLDYSMALKVIPLKKISFEMLQN
jgi:hypothetical protein|tara:strand:- start:341 stop:484 length:144 start_codon:yes stop_codon:yes gene_type:complete